MRDVWIYILWVYSYILSIKLKPPLSYVQSTLSKWLKVKNKILMVITHPREIQKTQKTICIIGNNFVPTTSINQLNIW